jgi:pimeloyl-ACP methyl ester carboxylesterase/predicted glycosyltransferase
MTVHAPPPPRAQTRARYPDQRGHVARDGVRIAWERYGDGQPTILLLPPWSIVHSRAWKGQIPYLSRHCRVVAFDGRGNGRSDRPQSPDAYAPSEFAADALAVLDATDTDRALIVGYSLGAEPALLLAADHSERVLGVVFVAPAVPLGTRTQRATGVNLFDQRRDTYEGWEKFNRHYWTEHYPEFLEFFFSELFSEPHSTKQIEDAVGWGLETTPETLIATALARDADAGEIIALSEQVRCPVLVVHGDRDRIRSHASGVELAAATGGTLVTLSGCGHGPQLRDPVHFNLLLRDLACPPVPPSRWTRARNRTTRALYVSSPIGLGHVRRDLAIADELRALQPDLQIDWLAQHPVTAVLERAGERIHPLSVELASESGHMQAEAHGHELHCFQALRAMDEILLANFMVFLDAARAEAYDLWIGDEAWDVDYHLHENPELKTAAYVWLTDFVGYLPMPGCDDREALLTADYNAEMIEQIDRYPRIRDRAIFVGDPEDIVAQRFGPDLPPIRDWTEEHFRFSGYITGFDPGLFADRPALRRALGYGPDEQVCIVTVGGSGVGSGLLGAVIEGFPEARRLVPNLRMIVVAGPRIDPESLPQADGLEIHSYVHELHRHLAACDLALIQGGLATAMELTAHGRPFIYFPLAQHFEQQIHVEHRLRRHRAGRRIDLHDATPSVIAHAIADELGRPTDYLPVSGDGAARAAAIINELF